MSVANNGSNGVMLSPRAQQAIDARLCKVLGVTLRADVRAQGFVVLEGLAKVCAVSAFGANSYLMKSIVFWYARSSCVPSRT